MVSEYGDDFISSDDELEYGGDFGSEEDDGSEVSQPVVEKDEEAREDVKQTDESVKQRSEDKQVDDAEKKAQEQNVENDYAKEAEARFAAMREREAVESAVKVDESKAEEVKQQESQANQQNMNQNFGVESTKKADLEPMVNDAELLNTDGLKSDRDLKLNDDINDMDRVFGVFALDKDGNIDTNKLGNGLIFNGDRTDNLLKSGFENGKDGLSFRDEKKFLDNDKFNMGGQGFNNIAIVEFPKGLKRRDIKEGLKDQGSDIFKGVTSGKIALADRKEHFKARSERLIFLGQEKKSREKFSLGEWMRNKVPFLKKKSLNDRTVNPLDVNAMQRVANASDGKVTKERTGNKVETNSRKLFKDCMEANFRPENVAKVARAFFQSLVGEGYKDEIKKNKEQITSDYTNNKFEIIRSRYANPRIINEIVTFGAEGSLININKDGKPAWTKMGEKMLSNMSKTDRELYRANLNILAYDNSTNGAHGYEMVKSAQGMLKSFADPQISHSDKMNNTMALQQQYFSVQKNAGIMNSERSPMIQACDHRGIKSLLSPSLSGLLSGGKQAYSQGCAIRLNHEASLSSRAQAINEKAVAKAREVAISKEGQQKSKTQDKVRS